MRLQQVARELTIALKDFGYNVTFEYVEEAVSKLVDATEQPRGGPETARPSDVVWEIGRRFRNAVQASRIFWPANHVE